MFVALNTFWSDLSYILSESVHMQIATCAKYNKFVISSSCVSHSDATIFIDYYIISNLKYVMRN